jgi:hypothetical protein
MMATCGCLSPVAREVTSCGPNPHEQARIAPATLSVFGGFRGIRRYARTLNVSGRQDLNLRPPGPQPGALPDCATPRGRSILGTVSRRSRPVDHLGHKHFGIAAGLPNRKWAGPARRDRHVRRGLCKLSSSANGCPSAIRPRGGSSTVEPRPSKAMMRVRFPSAASRPRRACRCFCGAGGAGVARRSRAGVA